MANLTNTQKEDLVKAVQEFPAALKQAKIDWAKYKVGLERGLFGAEQVAEIMDFYSSFPQYWALVRPNFFVTPEGGPMPDHIKNYGRSVDAWIRKLLDEMRRLNIKADSAPMSSSLPPGAISGLGIAPLLIAGILIAGALGIGGAIWGIGYIKKQRNISNLIDEYVAGRVPEDVLTAAIEAEETGFFGSVSNILKYGVIALIAVVALPALKGLFDGSKD